MKLFLLLLLPANSFNTDFWNLALLCFFNILIIYIYMYKDIDTQKILRSIIFLLNKAGIIKHPTRFFFWKKPDNWRHNFILVHYYIYLRIYLDPDVTYSTLQHKIGTFLIDLYYSKLMSYDVYVNLTVTYWWYLIIKRYYFRKVFLKEEQRVLTYYKDYFQGWIEMCKKSNSPTDWYPLWIETRDVVNMNFNLDFEIKPHLYYDNKVWAQLYQDLIESNEIQLNGELSIKISLLEKFVSALTKYVLRKRK